MPGIDFNRQAFVPSAEKTPQPATRLLGAVFLVIVLAAVCVVGYKVTRSSTRRESRADAPGPEKIQQHLAWLGNRRDTQKKRRTGPGAGKEQGERDVI